MGLEVVRKAKTCMTKHVKIFATSSHSALAESVAEHLQLPLGQRSLKTFSCGEMYINYDETVRGHDVFIVGTIRPGHIHNDFFEFFLMADAAKRSFAKSVHIIIPHFGYSRQDKIHAARESISMKLCADLIVQSGAGHIITLDLHADQSQAFFDVPVDNITPRRMFASYIREKNLEDLLIVSPDAGGAKSAKKFADLVGAELAIMHKNRPQHNESEITHVIGDVEGKTCLLYDDMVDTAGSVCNAKEALQKKGAKEEVYLCATHAIFSGPAVQRLGEAGFAEIITTNSIPVSEGALPNLTQLDISPLLAHLIENVLEEKSVSQLFF